MNKKLLALGLAVSATSVLSSCIIGRQAQRYVSSIEGWEHRNGDQWRTPWAGSSSLTASIEFTVPINTINAQYCAFGYGIQPFKPESFKVTITLVKLPPLNSAEGACIFFINGDRSKTFELIAGNN
jgi:hypothetical protein